MKRVMVFALVWSLSRSLAFAAGPVDESAKRASRDLAQSAGSPSTASSGKPWLWSGVALAGGGVALMMIGRESCKTVSVGNISGSIVTCTESTSLKWMGLGVAAAGGALIAVGASKHSQFLVLPNAVAYRMRF